MFLSLVRIIMFVLLCAAPDKLFAQKPVKKYTVNDGRMFIEITKDIREGALDSFIVQFDLQNLHLKDFIKKNLKDSLEKNGWRVEKNNETGFIISKLLATFEKINNPVDRIIFTEKHPTFAERFPATNNGIIYGYNRFQNHYPFQQKDSVVTFYLKDFDNAKKVMLAGSFNDWAPNALAMQKTDSGWISQVKLTPGKYWYKFIVDGRWRVDNDNYSKENDGYGNINSVLFVTNTTLFLRGYENADNVSVAGSFNQWRAKDIMMARTASGWILPLYLAEGTHTYKFVVDGQRFKDDTNKNLAPDGEGGYNSVIALGKPHLFKLNGFQNAKEVRLVGSFNNWRNFELPMKKTQSGWELNYVIGSGNYEYKFWVDGTLIADPGNPSQVNNGNSLLIIDPNYTFRLKGYSTARKVFLAGDFNNWNPLSLSMKKEGDEWVFPVHLSVGKHLYKFIVDGEWIKDPSNKLWEQNEHSTGNSILWVDK